MTIDLTATDAPDSATGAADDVAERVRRTAPVIERHRDWSDDNRRLHDEVVEALADAGVFRLRRPRAFGGDEADTRTLVAVADALGRIDGSVAWTAAVYWIPTWMACMFPDAVQEEIFATPDVRICGTLSPSATAVPAPGGVVVNGKWGWQTGSRHAHWQEALAILASEDGQAYPVVALIPMADLLVLDDWDTAALCATGSVSTVAHNVFVPQDRVLPLPQVLEGRSASATRAASPAYRVPLLPVASASSVGTPLGLARAAIDTFFERLPHRKITYTGYEQQASAPLTHHEVAYAITALDEAEFHAQRLADAVDEHGRSGAPWDLVDRARARADLGATVRRAKEAVDLLASASGGTSVFRQIAMGRIQRDVNAIHLHALMHPQTNNELYGRVLCGQAPDTLYL